MSSSWSNPSGFVKIPSWYLIYSIYLIKSATEPSSFRYSIYKHKRYKHVGALTSEFWVDILASALGLKDCFQQT